MVSDPNTGTLLLELFFHYWYLWVIMGIIIFFFMFVMFKIMGRAEDYWNERNKRKQLNYDVFQQIDIRTDGTIVETIVKRPKGPQPDAIIIEDILAEVKDK